MLSREVCEKELGMMVQPEGSATKLDGLKYPAGVFHSRGWKLIHYDLPLPLMIATRRKGNWMERPIDEERGTIIE